MINQLRIGIPVVGEPGWLGGVSFIEGHMKALASLPDAERPQQLLVLSDENPHLEYYRAFLDKFDGIIYQGGDSRAVQALVNVPLIHCPSQDDLFSQIDFYFPVCFNVLPGRAAASWIPDFQHKHLPDFFSSQEIIGRDELCRRIAEQAQLIVCTSRTVEKDFRRFYPASPANTTVLSLRVSPEQNWFSGDCAAVREKYGLPERFIICANQFWRHKNHRCLFEAIALLRKKGEDVHIVCTGAPYDYRHPGYFQELLAFIQAKQINQAVHLLGVIPRFDQIQLIRQSLFVVQPSLFEGLSLIVQEARALGKTILLSAIDVHLEYEYGVYFDPCNIQDLADKTAALAAVSLPGPEPRRELEAALQATALTTVYAKDFCKLVQKAARII